jgi:hypothetical protein
MDKINVFSGFDQDSEQFFMTKSKPLYKKLSKNRTK